MVLYIYIKSNLLLEFSRKYVIELFSRTTLDLYVISVEKYTVIIVRYNI